MHLTLIVSPGHAERDDTLWFNKSFNQLRLFKFGMLVVHILNRNQHFFHSLDILRLAWMLALKVLNDFFHFHGSNIYFRLVMFKTHCYDDTNISLFCRTTK